MEKTAGVVSRYRVPLPGLPAALEGTRLVQLSDFHRGNGRTDPLILAAVDAANELDADYVLLTGDFIDRYPRDVPFIMEQVDRLRARRGRFAVYGNHDYHAPTRIATELAARGIRLLRNEACQLETGLWLAGLDDLRCGVPDLEKTLSGLPAGAALVLMSHDPQVFPQVERPCLILSGHTHGAQIRVWFPWPELVCRVHLGTRYVHGWFRRGQVQMYVNRGIGVTGPWPLNRRMWCPPEVSLFELVRP